MENNDSEFDILLFPRHYILRLVAEQITSKDKINHLINHMKNNNFINEILKESRNESFKTIVDKIKNTF